MPHVQAVFANDEIYHIFNRGVEKRQIFLDQADYRRFIETLLYYRIKAPSVRFSYRHRMKIFKKEADNSLIVEIICFCLMPNHFHLLVRQLEENGITVFFKRVLNSYAKYFNTKYKRVGPLFQGFFKAVHIEDDRQLLQVSRYIHRNPKSGFIVKDLRDYPYSSYKQYIGLEKGFCSDKIIKDQFNSDKGYEDLVLDDIDYTSSIAFFAEALLDSDA